MKACIFLWLTLAAGMLQAQPPTLPDQTLQTTTAAQSSEAQKVFKPQEKNYAVHHGRITYDGTAVQAFNAPGHLAIFNPFDHANFPAPDNTVWQDKTTGKATGWSIFSIKF